MRAEGRAAGTQRTTADTARLLHELEVHQIELEMQNAALREARDEVEAALERYTDLYDFAPTGYFSVDESGLILEVNLTGAGLLGANRAGVVNRKLQRFVAPESRAPLQAMLDRVFAGTERQTCEVSLRRGDGTTIWADVHAAPAATARGTHRWCRVSVADVTALRHAAAEQIRADALAAWNRELDLEITRRRKLEASLLESEQHLAGLLEKSRHMEEQLRQLSRGILHAQEKERKRISRDLHDVVAQSALNINVHLAMLNRESVGKSPVRRGRIARTRRLLAELVEDVHRFSRELRPPTLDDLGLVPALTSYTREFAQRAGVDVVFTPAAGGERLSGARKTVLFRVVQEALTNVAKHAHAKRVTVRLESTPRFVQVDVEDDGTAFDVERVFTSRRHRRLGLLGMRERLEMVGGTFAITSTPGKGTHVTAQVPFRGRVAPGSGSA